MEKDLVKRLTDFGLSVNQAKVYLSIVLFKATNVNEISKATRIYRQDVYKILPKLEEMGLVTQTVDRPIIIEAIPAEEALSYIVSMEQQKASERIKRLKADLKALANTIEKTAKVVKITTPDTIETQVVFLSTERAINNRLDVSYANARIKCDLVITFELLMRRLPLLRKRFQALAENKVKTRLLLETTKNKDLVKKTVEEMLPSTGDFTVKLTTGKITVKPYLIIDRKEIYITSVKKTPFLFPCLLWTNSPNVIAIYEDNFEKVWMIGSS
jgi:sugar-specific transcriptional regulator TrmB